MAKSAENLENLNFIWDVNATSGLRDSLALQGAAKERDFQDYLDFLEDVSPAQNVKRESVLTRDLVFEL